MRPRAWALDHALPAVRSLTLDRIRMRRRIPCVHVDIGPGVFLLAPPDDATLAERPRRLQAFILLHSFHLSLVPVLALKCIVLALTI